MRKDNIFKVGEVVSGESLIGYRDEYKRLCRDVLDNRGNLSLVGLPRMGKTSLMQKLHNEAKKNYPQFIEIFINLQELVPDEKFPFDFLLKYIVEKIEYKANRRLKSEECEDFYVLKKFKDSLAGSMYLRDSFKDLFEELKSLNLHVLLSFDEFDAAEKFFKTNADYELFRTLANANYAVSLVFISRRRLYMIEKKNDNNSTFHGAFPEKHLTGFSDEDLRTVFDILQNEYDICLEPAGQERIRYYAGRSPFICSALCHELVEKKIDGQDFLDVDKIYGENVASTVINYSNDLFNRLKNDGHLSKLIGILFGPSIDVTQRDKDLLTFMGYLSEDKRTGKNYLALSEFFTDYLHNIHYVADSWKNILAVDKLIKSLIADNFPSLDETDMNAAYAKVFGDKKFNAPLRKKFIDKNFQDYGHESTLLDVLSLKDVFVLISAHWDDIFNVYFGKKPLAAFEEEFDLCARARDPLAHNLGEKLLTESERKRVNVACSKIIELVENCRHRLPKVAADEKISAPETKNDVSKKNVGKEGLLTNIVLNPNTGGLKGDIFGAKGSVSKKLLKARPADYVGRTLKVRVEDINPQGKRYILTPLED